MSKIKVLIVEDSAFMRKLITDFFSEDGRLEIVGTARNGQEAIDKVKQLQPDVVTLDIEMPVMNGLDALKIIMEQCPVPTVMLSSTTVQGAENTMIAMQYGAVDFIAKPSGAISLDLHKVKDEIIEKVISASKANIKGLRRNIRVSEKPSVKPDTSYSKIEKKPIEFKPDQKLGLKKRLICIGTSTGGPRALQEVLTKIPKNIGAPIVVVQHMPPGFTKSLAQRLDTICEINVKEAEDGEILHKGTAYIAPGGYHLKVQKVGAALAAVVDQSPIRGGHRPSVDVMFESISEVTEYSKVAVIMTGMGSDGSEGLQKLKKSGEVKAIAESQETSIVFGMPKSAIATNLVDEVVNLEGIADVIVKYAEL